MAQEIERKYLVKSDEFKQQAARSVRIIQGYLSSVPERTVRVRVKGDKGFLTIKGIGNESGASRYEWESEIPVSEAQELLKICEPGVIDKTRYLVEHENHLFEVDEFYQSNQGLTVAEVELTTEAQTVNKPSWLGEEVTGDTRYYNSILMKQPYTTW
ncbi:CYTH domain-containing protein [Shewanella colwelliana]|uniref:CYTH domain-containing protein n=1 Tax=Shewanella colwelliana TaxID=23 RepID=UPI00048FB507|nr:CYTH domain-containing protein [Shewanella colwelliana]